MKSIEMDYSKRCWEEQEKVHNRWHPDIPPALEVEPEEEVYLQTRDALEAMAFSDVTGRVAGLLLRLADPDTGVVEGYSHQDMASMVGCLRESFTAVLDRFKSSGTVAVSRKRIEIVDRAKLERVLAQRSSVRQ